MNVDRLKEADRILNGPRGGGPVPIPKSFLLQLVTQANHGFAGGVNFSVDVTGEVPFELRAISLDSAATAVSGIYLQIRLPSGRYLFGGNGVDLQTFAGVGSARYLIDPPEICEPGSKLQASLTFYEAGFSAVTSNLVFEGAFLYGKRAAPVKPAPRCLVNARNQNILAPCWMAGQGPPTPPGFSDYYFVYSSNLAKIQFLFGVAPPIIAQIQIDPDSDFVCRRILFDVERLTGGAPDATCSINARIHTQHGYALCDDFIDLVQYCNAVELGHLWTIQKSDLVFIELAGISNNAALGQDLAVQVFMEGCKRRQAGL